MRQYQCHTRFSDSHASRWRVPVMFLPLLLLILLMPVAPARAAWLVPAGGESSPRQASLHALGQAATEAGREFIEGVQAFNDEDFYRAERIWLPLARAGHDKAQFFLGVLHSSVRKDPATAVYWYRQAAERGNSDAQYNLGLAYARGIGVKKNVAEAIHWWRAASLQGNSDSQYNLGILYATGANGVHQDLREAKRWWLLAAAGGDALAQYNLGAMYANGVAGKQSYCEAKRWWSKSLSNGFRRANMALQDLNRRVRARGLTCR